MSIESVELMIDEKARSYARIYASLINDEFQRKRANAAITALFAYIGMLKNEHNVNIQNSMTLYRNPSLCSQFEIADFYVNNYHIDVRVTVDESGVLIPKIHYDNNIVPDFYVVVKVSQNLDNAEFLGIIDTAQTKPEAFDYHYFIVKSTEFINNDEFVSKIRKHKIQKIDINEHNSFKNNYLAFVDNELDAQKKNELLKHLFNCSDCRTEFCCFTGFEMVNCNASNYPEILDDSTLDVIGAQGIESGKYEGKEETVYIGPDDSAPKIENIPDDEEQVPDDTDYKTISPNELPVTEKSIPIASNAKNQPPKYKFEIEGQKIAFVPSLDAAGNILDDGNNSDLTIIEDDSNPSEAGSIDNLEVVYETDDLPEATIPSIKTDYKNNGNDESEKMNLVPDNNEPSIEIEQDNSNVQKVIIDYDDKGDPIYSYITNADGTGPAAESDNISDNNFTDNLLLPEDGVPDAEITETDELDFSLDDLVENEKIVEMKEEELPLNSETDTVSDESAVMDTIFLPEEIQRIEDNAADVQEEDSKSELVYDDATDEESAEKPNTVEKDISDMFEMEEYSSKFKKETEKEIAEQESNNAEAEETETPETVASEKEKGGENAEKSDSAYDILDQMFVDGALEREAREQQVLSYSPLSTPVDSHIPEPDELKEPEMATNATPEKKSDYEKYNAEEVKEVTDYNEPEKESEHFQNETVEFIPAEPEYKEETEEDEDKDYSDNYADDKHNKDKENDELLSVLPNNPVNPSVQMFDGYIESELTKNEDDDSSDRHEVSGVNQSTDDEAVEEFEEYDDSGESEEEFEEYDEDDEEEDDDENEEGVKPSPFKSILVVVVIIAIMALIGGVGTFLFMKNKSDIADDTSSPVQKPSTPEVVDEQANDMFDIPIDSSNSATPAADMNIAGGEQTVPPVNAEAPAVKEEAGGIPSSASLPVTPKEANSAEQPASAAPAAAVPSNGDINKTITNALSSGGNLVTLRGLQWFCPSELFTDKAFKAYMQGVDNTLKQNLKNNIMGATVVPPKNIVTAKFAIDNNRNLRKVIISESSGSEEIDKIVLRSINETFEGEKSPILSDSPMKADMYYLKVSIKL